MRVSARHSMAPVSSSQDRFGYSTTDFAGAEDAAPLASRSSMLVSSGFTPCTVRSLVRTAVALAASAMFGAGCGFHNTADRATIDPSSSRAQASLPARATVPSPVVDPRLRRAYNLLRNLGLHPYASPAEPGQRPLVAGFSRLRRVTVYAEPNRAGLKADVRQLRAEFDARRRALLLGRARLLLVSETSGSTTPSRADHALFRRVVAGLFHRA